MTASDESSPHLSDDEKWQILTRPQRLGEILLKHGKLSLSQLESLVEEQKKTGQALGEIIVSRGIMTRKEVLEALKWQYESSKTALESAIELKDKDRG